MIRSIFCSLFLFSMLAGCSDTSKRSAFKEYLNDIVKDKEYSEIRSGLNDSVRSWIDRGLDGVQFLRHTDWTIDNAVFFDSKKEKALLLILVLVKGSSLPVDYVKTIGAEKINGKWEFYYVSYTVIECFRSEHNGSPYSFHELADIGRNELINDGFVKCLIGCRINYDYIDSDVWFAGWRQEMHKQFLQNTLPKDPIAAPGERMQ